jgi:cell volume regulation protein A
LWVLVVARPASVVAAALPFGLSLREQAFLSWSGLRGAVPVVLAMIPVMNGVEHAGLLLDVIVVVVVTYTLLQGTTLPWLARRLGVIQSGQAMEIQMEAAPLDEMNAHVLQVTIPEQSRMHGVYISQLRLPMPATISLLLREGEPMHLNPNIRLQSGDQLLVVAPERVRAATERRLRAVGRGGALAGWFGERGERSDD